MFIEKTTEEIKALNPEEFKVYTAAKKENDKISKNATEKKGIVQEHFEKKGAKSKENISNGGSNVIVNLTNKTMIRFTKDFKNIKKGHTQEVSDTALEIYQEAGVIEKL